MDSPTISPNDRQLSLIYSWSLDTLDMSLNKGHYQAFPCIYTFVTEVQRQSKE